MTDLSKTIAPKSDQLNADDLIGRETMTIKVTKVSLLAGEQPIAISYEGDTGHPYKPCKSMRRVLVQIWGSDGSAYIGRSMSLYRDDKVKFGGADVGGIRISHLSHITEPVTLALTASKAVRKPFVVRPLKIASEAAHAPSAAPQSDHVAGDDAATEFISPDQATEIGDVVAGHPEVKASFVKWFGALAKIPAAKYADALAHARKLTTGE